MDRLQINVRLSEDLADRLDAKRVELKQSLGKIPSRSEVVRLAIHDYLGGSKRDSGKRGQMPP